MTLYDLYRGLRPFAELNEIISTVKRSKYFNSVNEDINNATKIQLLDTSQQRTYLVSTGERIYKIVDDRRSNSPKIQWSRKINKVFDDGKFKGHLIPRSENTYNLVMEAIPDKLNLVSRKLFANIDFADAVANLDTRHVVG